MKLLIIIISIFLASCATTKYVEVPVEKVKVEYKDKFVHDSIYIKDSIFIDKKNDTIFLNKYKYIIKEKLVTDTIVQRDTIPKTIRVETIKEVNKLKNWQIVLMIMGGGFIVLLLYKLKKYFK